MKKYYYHILFYTTKLIYNFPSTNQLQKLMKKDTLAKMKKKRKENEREQKIKKKLGCKFIRIEPEAEKGYFC